MKKLIKKLDESKEIYLSIKVKPGAPKTILTDMLNDDILKIDVTASAEKGRANQELIKYLAKNFSVNKNNVKIISGKKDRIKLVIIISSA